MPTASRLAGLLAAASLVVLVAAPAIAQLYRWTDASGKEHFTSDPSQVPAAQRQPGAATPGSGGSLNVIESRPVLSSSSSPTTSGASKPPAAAAPVSEKIGGADEASWRARVSKLRGEIADLEVRDTECTRHPPGMPGGFDVVNGYSVNRRQLDRAAAKVDACRAASDQLGNKRMELDRLEERARIAGVPPGWLR